MTKYISSLIVILLTSTNLYAEDDVVFTNFNIAYEKEGVTLTDELHDFLKSDEGTVLFHAGGAYFGVDPRYTEIARGFITNNTKSNKEKSEWKVTVQLDKPGYTLCDVQWKSTSGSGKRTLYIAMKPNNKVIYTQKLWSDGLGRGRSWQKGTIYLSFIKSGLYDSWVRANKCRPPDSLIRKGKM